MTCKENTFVKTTSDFIGDRSSRKYNTTNEDVDIYVALIISMGLYSQT